MAMARYCERCGACFPLSDVFYNRVRLYKDNPEVRTLRDSVPDFIDKELCHNCAMEFETWLKKL